MSSVMNSFYLLLIKGAAILNLEPCVFKVPPTIQVKKLEEPFKKQKKGSSFWPEIPTSKEGGGVSKDIVLPRTWKILLPRYKATHHNIVIPHYNGVWSKKSEMNATHHNIVMLHYSSVWSKKYKMNWEGTVCVGAHSSAVATQLFLCSFPVLAWVHCRYSGCLPPSVDMQIRSTGDSELSVCVCVIASLFLYGPAMNWWLDQGALQLCFW